MNTTQLERQITGYFLSAVTAGNTQRTEQLIKTAVASITKLMAEKDAQIEALTELRKSLSEVQPRLGAPSRMELWAMAVQQRTQIKEQQKEIQGLLAENNILSQALEAATK